MSYTALYRRFRPQLFADLVGQEHISRTLAAAVLKGSLVHAYLFCGPRGTGKTSTAKILARAVNCLEPTAAGEPCGKCAACERSIQGESLDVLEIDAASNRGIDEIRDLRERVKYAPALEKYKVYIIDEVHMLTAPAFNALLKTLEEPPAQVIFVLATTEPHKIPLTVLSRCQRFDFRRIADEAVAAHLTEVAACEGFTLEPAALQLIVRKVEGGMRDALGLLDQSAGFGGGAVTESAVMTLLGAVNQEFIARLTERMLAGDLASLMEMVAQLHAEGHDLRQFLHDLLEYQRELLLKKLAPQQDAPLPDWAAQATPQRLVKILQSLGDADGRLRNSLQPRLTLELALIQACGAPAGAAQPVAAAPPPSMAAAPVGASGDDELPWADEPPTAGAPQTKPAAPPQTVAIRDEDLPWPDDAPPLPEPPEEPVDFAPAALSAAPPKTEPEQENADPMANRQESSAELLLRLQAAWPRLRQEISHANVTTGAFLAEAEPCDLRKNQLTLLFGADFGLFMNSVCKPGAARALVEEKLSAFAGLPLTIAGQLAESKAQAAAAEDDPLCRVGRGG